MKGAEQAPFFCAYSDLKLAGAIMIAAGRII